MDLQDSDLSLFCDGFRGFCYKYKSAKSADTMIITRCFMSKKSIS